MNLLKKAPVRFVLCAALLVFAALHLENIPVYFNNFAMCRKYNMDLADGELWFSIVSFVVNMGNLALWLASAVLLAMNKRKGVCVCLLAVSGLAVLNAVGGTVSLLAAGMMADPTLANYLAYARDLLLWAGIWLALEKKQPLLVLVGVAGLAGWTVFRILSGAAVFSAVAVMRLLLCLAAAAVSAHYLMNDAKTN